MERVKRVCVIGAGPAGMTAAAAAAEGGCKTVVFDRNEKAGKKLYITGKGRCNVTNDCEPSEFLKNVVSNPKFLYSGINRFSPRDTVDFFTGGGVPLKTERGRRVFPASDKASDITRCLQRAAEKAGAEFIFGAFINDIVYAGGKFLVSASSSGFAKNEQASASAYKEGNNQFDRVILATGGVSYPATGSDGSGFDLARRLGHKVTPLFPALVPLLTREKFAGALAGLSLKNIGFKVIKGGKTLYEDFGEMLFTHDGVSGPVVLSASSLINKCDLSDVYISINLKPALSEKQLDARILRDFSAAINCRFKNALGGLLPKSLIPVIIERSGIDPEKAVNQISRHERERLAGLLTDFRLGVRALGAIEQGIVTSGGADVSEIDPKTMESRLIKGLYFAGEMIDVDALTGGYNIQIALSTGRVAGQAAAAN